MSRQHAAPPALKGFTFVRLLGSGGFADVFLYQQELPRRQVAVKVLLSDGLTAATTAAFVAEANLMAQLSHPYIVKIYHADVSDDGRPYLIMEYLAGPNLADQYKRQPFTVVDALRTGVRLSSAIATAHVAGVLHRDIKPANVLTNDYGHPALTDFGIASALEEDLPVHTTTRASVSESGATTGSQSVGMSIPWSPPEMFEEDPKPDVRSDVFSLAATIYTLLAGRTPFEVAGRNNQSIDLMTRIERGTITPMERTDVPSSLLAVLRKGMATSREQRFSSAVEFARALQRVELELKYAPTQIEVPNLVVPAPAERVDEDKADATRARSVTPIVAQPVVNSPAPAPRSSSVVSSPEATVVRGAPVQVEQTVVRGAGATASAPAATPIEKLATTKKRRLGVPSAVAGGVLVAVVLGVVLANVLGSGAQPASAPSEAAVDSDSNPVISDTVPTPVLVSVGQGSDATTVEFVWSNPEGDLDDTFAWQRTDGAGDRQMTPTSDPKAEITGVSAGTTVCLDIFVLRSGQLSPEPLSQCYP